MVDWPGLLQWSTKYHDGTAPSNFSKMSDDDLNFLKGAMEEMLKNVEDLNKVLEEGLIELRKDIEGKADASKVLTTLSVVERCCDDPDCCRNLELFGGIKPLLSCAMMENEEVQALACELLALMIANNESMQEKAVKSYDALETIMKNRDLITPEQMRLLAAIVRGHHELERIFLEKGGMDYLCEVIQACIKNPVKKNLRVIEKSFSFLKHLFLQDMSRIKSVSTNLNEACFVVLKAMNLEENHFDIFSIQFSELLVAVCHLMVGSLSPTLLQECEQRLQVLKKSGKENQEERSLEIKYLQHVIEGNATEPEI